MVTMASLAGLVFFGCGVYLWFRDNGGRSAERKKVGLEHISGIWTPHKKKIMQLEQLVPIWRETHSEGQPGDGEESIGLQLEHQGLRQFYNDHIRLNPFITGNVLVVIEKCLSLLDKEGSCPSVVNLRGDPEALLEKNAYTMLGKTNLIDHTLHVAEEMRPLTGDRGPLWAKGLMVALGHDLGKLPSLRGRFYSLGDHPLISATILDQMPAFKALPYKEEILRAVKDHHRVPKPGLGQKLKEADQAARRGELATGAELMESQGEEPPPVVSTGSPRPADPPPDIFWTTPPVEKVVVKATNLAWFVALATILDQMPAFKALPYKEEILRAVKDHHRVPKPGLGQKLKEADQAARRGELATGAELMESQGEEPPPVVSTGSPRPADPPPDIFWTTPPVEKVVVKATNLAWFDPDRFLELLKPYINRLNGGRWDAFSMRDGHCYVQVKTMWEVTKKLAREQKESSVSLADGDEESRRNILYSVVQRLREDKDAIARGLIKDGYFGAPFIVTNEGWNRV